MALSSVQAARSVKKAKVSRAAAVLRSRYRLREFLFQLVLGCILFLIAVVMVGPMLYIMAVSFTDSSVYMPNTFYIWPQKWSTLAYRYVLAGSGFTDAAKASLFITLVGTPIKLMILAAFAYMVSKPALPGRRTIMGLILFTMLFHGGLIPSYLLLKNLRLLDSWWAIILPATHDPWALLVLKSFYQTIPAEIEDSAKIDGASEVGIFFRIVLPLSKAPLAAFTLFFAVAFWNTYFAAIIYIKDSTKWPLQVMLQQVVLTHSAASRFLSSEAVEKLKLMQQIPSEMVKMATVMIVTAPILVVYPFLQKYFAKGVLLGSIKG
jgi:putative aldouronate transport system permease protein